MINKKVKVPETHWFCYYCGTYLGTTSGGAKLGKCPVCGKEQVGSGIDVLSKENIQFLRRLEKRKKEQQFRRLE